MFYVIVAIILVLFYIFVAPKNIKGTINVVAAVFLLVTLLIILLLVALKILQSPPELWLGLGMIGLGLWSLYDLIRMGRKYSQK